MHELWRPCVCNIFSLTHGDCSDHVDIQHLDCSERNIVEPNHIGPEDGGALGNVDWKVKDEDLAEVIPDSTSLLDRLDDAGKVVISKYHLSSLEWTWKKVQRESEWRVCACWI